MAKPNCYECIYRRNIPGDTHSKCVHPDNGATSVNKELFEFMSILGGAGGALVTTISDMKITGDPHGIKNGWFNWPFNFDPIWLNECNGFKPKN
jgi:hypothetical protein